MTKDMKTLIKFAKQLSELYSDIFECEIVVNVCESPAEYYIRGKGTVQYLCSVCVDGDEYGGSYQITTPFIMDVKQIINEFVHEVCCEYFYVDKIKLQVKE